MSWWFTAFRGAVALALGIAVLVASLGESHLATFLALYLILAGLAGLRSATAEPVRGRARLRRAAGIVAIVVAVGVLGRQLVVEAGPDWIITTVLGIGTIAIGSMRLAGGFAQSDQRAGRARPRLPAAEVALALVELLLGGAFLTADLDWIWPAAAVWGIVSGAALLRDADRRRRSAGRPLQPASRA